MSEAVPPGTGRARLGGIEALRGVAASAVVLYHAARHVDKAYGAPRLAHALLPGHAGVDLFFVLSGFIILYVHAGDAGRPARLAHYAARRFSRVMPLYWVALGGTLVMAWLGQHGLPSPARLLLSALLLPSQVDPVLGVAWTLKFEIVFYAVFAVLILSRPVGLSVLAAWCACVLCFGMRHGAGRGWLPGSLYTAYNIEFFFGMGAAYLAMRRRIMHPALPIAAGGLLFGSAMVAEYAGLLDGYAVGARWAYGVAAAVLIGGLVARERVRAIAVPGLLRRLGEASYAIYLFQFVFIGAVWQAMRYLGLAADMPRLPCFAILAGAGLAGGYAVHRLVERPLLRIVRFGSRGLAAAAPVAAG